MGCSNSQEITSTQRKEDTKMKAASALLAEVETVPVPHELSEMQKFFLKSGDPKQSDKASTAVLLAKDDKRAFSFATKVSGASTFKASLKSHNQLAFKLTEVSECTDKNVKFVLMCAPHEACTLKLDDDCFVSCDGWFLCASEVGNYKMLVFEESAANAIKFTANEGSLTTDQGDDCYSIGFAMPDDNGDTAQALKAAFYKK